jgi:peptidoglycan/LPS O-acetylase OafA/YrhL
MDDNGFFKDGQIPSLNGWRAVAILLVLLDHSVYTVGFPESKIPMWGWVILQQGNLGVRIFFVLSGFLITHLLLREVEKSRSREVEKSRIVFTEKLFSPPVPAYFAGLFCLSRCSGTSAQGGNLFW